MALLVSDLESQMAQLRGAGAQDAVYTSKDTRQLPKPPLPHSSGSTSRPEAGSRSGSPRPTSPGNASPRPLLSQQLESAVSARSSSPGRSASPPTTLTQQLQEAVSSRARRNTEEHDSGGMCTHCGTEALKNSVRCASCADCYHIRCLSTSQAARFKGRRWLCGAQIVATPEMAATCPPDRAPTLRR